MPHEIKTRHIQLIDSTKLPGACVLPSPVEKVRSACIKNLQSLLSTMFDSVDDTLFQLADRAECNDQQEKFFDAMREIRVKRRGIEKGFQQAFDEYFRVLPTLGAGKSEANDFADVSVDALSLVNHDELEEHVAIDGMVLKARINATQQLTMWTTRLETLLPYTRLTALNNPLDPHQVCYAFVQASKILEVNIKAKIILYKLFDQKVLINIEDVLAQANQSLVDDGVLVGLTYAKTQFKGRAATNAVDRPFSGINGSGTNGSVINSSVINSSDMDSSVMGRACVDKFSVSGPAASNRSHGASSAHFNDFAINDFANKGSAMSDESIPTLTTIAATNSAAATVDGDLFRTLQQLLSHQRSTTSVPSGGENHSHHHSSFATGPAHVLPQQQLMSLLSELQLNPTRIVTCEQLGHEGAVHRQFDIRGAVDELLQRKLNADANLREKNIVVGKTDNDVINLVAMLFEFILDDKNLPESIKVRIGRLQIPVLKVAITDKGFFSCTTHPVRRLLNSLAQAGVGLSDKDQQALIKDKLFLKIDEVVAKVITELNGGAELFEHLLKDFNEFVANEERRARLLEQRVKDVEEGKAKSERARLEVEALVHEKTKGEHLPSTLLRVLNGAWSNYLCLIYLKQGKEHLEWHKAVRVVDDLIWSVKPKLKESDRQKLMSGVTALLVNVQEGLRVVSFNPSDLNQLLDELETIHLDCAMGKVPAYLKAVAQMGVEEVSEEEFAASFTLAMDTNGSINIKRNADEDDALPVLVDKISDDVALLTVANLLNVANSVDQSEEFVLEQQSACVTSCEEPAASCEHDASVEPVANKAQEIEEIELTTPGIYSGVEQKSAEPTEDRSNQEHDAYMEHVNALEVGAWVEFITENNAKIRCKLAAKIRSADKLIFVNRSGMKIAEKTSMGLCVELRRGTVKFLDDALLFDRALAAVIGSLRRTGNSVHQH